MEESVVNQVPPGPVDNGMGFGSKFINVFLNPRKTFMALDNKPTWLVPLLLLILLTIISTQLTFPMIMDAQLDRIRSNANIPPEQMTIIENQLAENMSKQRLFATIGQVVVMPIIFLILAGIFYFVGSVILGGDSSYKKVLSVMSWSTVISILGVLIVTPLILLKGNMNVTLSLALLLPSDAMDSTLYNVLKHFDFFTIWYLAVFGYGFALIYRFSLAKAYVTFGVLWGIWIVINTVFASTFKMFGM